VKSDKATALVSIHMMVVNLAPLVLPIGAFISDTVSNWPDVRKPPTCRLTHTNPIHAYNLTYPGRQRRLRAHTCQQNERQTSAAT